MTWPWGYPPAHRRPDHVYRRGAAGALPVGCADPAGWHDPHSLGNAFHNGALVSFTVNGDGTAEGCIVGNVAFMWLRDQRFRATVDDEECDQTTAWHHARLWFVDPATEFPGQPRPPTRYPLLPGVLVRAP
jgi:hypothetical protein